MSLTPYESRTLADIEGDLRTADPRLDRMLAFHTTKGAWRRSALFVLSSPGRAFSRPPAGPRRASGAESARILTVAVGLVLVITLAIIGALTISPAKMPGRAQQAGPRSVPASSYAAAPHR